MPTDPLLESNETFWRIADTVAQALADGFSGCSGGCTNRPCEPDHDHAAVITRRIYKELGIEVPDDD